MYWKHNSLPFGFPPYVLKSRYGVSENRRPQLGWFVEEVAELNGNGAAADSQFFSCADIEQVLGGVKSPVLARGVGRCIDDVESVEQGAFRKNAALRLE